MHDVRKELGIGTTTAIPGNTKGIAAKCKIAEYEAKLAEWLTNYLSYGSLIQGKLRDIASMLSKNNITLRNLYYWYFTFPGHTICAWEGSSWKCKIPL